MESKYNKYIFHKYNCILYIFLLFYEQNEISWKKKYFIQSAHLKLKYLPWLITLDSELFSSIPSFNWSRDFKPFSLIFPFKISGAGKFAILKERLVGVLRVYTYFNT